MAAGVAALLAGTSALAQQQAATPPAGEDADAYVCAIAGKCDDAAATEETPTIAAPATKGFRLAAQQTPTTPAPQTRGFRLATGTRPATTASSTGPAAATPTANRFRFATARPSAVASSGTSGTIRPRGRGNRNHYAAGSVRPASTPGIARSDLMLTFELNSANMTPAAEARARTFAHALMMEELRGKRFMIAGHTDTRGSRAVNIDLSRRRAQAVADYLIAQGVDRSRVEVKGVGPDQPLPGRAGEANRRVEAVLLS